jgi:hypothetical protein
MHITPLLEQFRTGTKGKINCVIVNAVGKDGKPVEYEREGDNYQAGVGSAVTRLVELLELRRQRSSFWYKFFNGGYACLELDISIKRLREELDRVSVAWTE